MIPQIRDRRLAPDEPDIQDDAWLAFVTNAWSRIVIQPFLIAAMTAAFMAGPLIVLQIIIPGIPWQALIPVCFFVTLESVYTTIWLSRPTQRGLNRFAYRAAEFIFIAVMMRLLAWAVANSWPDLATWKRYLFEPLIFFSDPFFLIGLILAFLVWQRSQFTGDIFERLSLDRAEATYYASASGQSQQFENRPLALDRGALISTFLEQWLWGGLVLVICAALSTFDLSNRANIVSPFAWARLDMPPLMLTALLIYFLAGFLLLSQGRLAMLNARWLINGVTKGAQVERSWYRYSLRLLVVIGFVAAFLPLGSTVALGRILELIISGLMAMAALVMLLFATMLAWLLPTQTTNSNPVPVANPVPTALPTPNLPSAASETATMVLSAAFWAVAIVMTVIAIGFFLRDRGYWLDRQVWSQFWALFRGWLAGLWRGFSVQMGAFRQTVRARRLYGKKKRNGRSSPPWRFIRLNALSPREQLRYFYLSTVRRAGERGVARGQSETPLEFAQDLRENWPDAEEDVESVTDAFLKARYSPQPITKQDVIPVKERWKRLRTSLRRRSAPRDNNN